jgi:hypothetical protein
LRGVDQTITHRFFFGTRTHRFFLWYTASKLIVCVGGVHKPVLIRDCAKKGNPGDYMWFAVQNVQRKII